MEQKDNCIKKMQGAYQHNKLISEEGKEIKAMYPRAINSIISFQIQVPYIHPFTERSGRERVTELITKQNY